MRFFYLLVFIFIGLIGKSATITVGGSGNWSSTTPNAPWPGGILPASGDDIIVSGGTTLTVDGTYTVNSITVGSAANNQNTLLINSGFSLTITNTVTIVPPNGGTNTNLLNVGAGYLLCNGLNSSDSGNNTRDCNISISTGTLNVNGNTTLGSNVNRNAFIFSGGGVFKVSGTFTGGGTITSSLGNVEYYGASQTINSSFTIYNNLTLSTSGTKTSSSSFSTNGNLTIQGTSTLSASNTFTVAGNISISGSAQLSAAAAASFSVSGNIDVVGASQLIAPSSFTVNGNTSISGTSQLNCSANTTTSNLKGNFTVTSTNADPFLEGTGLMRFNGSLSSQTISTVLAAGETFYKLSISNTSASNPAIIFSNNVSVTEDYDHSNGFIDLSGKIFSCVGATTANQTFSLSGGGIITSTSGASVAISQGANVLSVDYSSFQIGDAINGITTNMTSDNSTWINSTFYGSTNFIKTGSNSQTFGGGNSFYGTCSFSTTPAASRWRMGDNGSGTAGTDTYYNGTFAHNGSANFIIGCNNTAHFYGTTTLNSTTSGGLYVGRQNGTTGSYTSTIHGPVTVNVSQTGAVYFADATTSYSNTTIFENTIQVNSLASSTGDVYFGNNAASTIVLTNTAQYIAGSIAGRTSVYLRKVTQNGSLTQTISGSVPNSKLFCGNSSLPCVFNGPVSFNVDTLSIINSTFHDNVTFTADAQHTLSSNTFNGMTNSFTKNGSNNNSTTGGNTFIAGSSSVFTNNGTGYWRLANTTADDYNGNVTFIQTSSGALQPTYNTTSTFAGNISTVGTSTAIDFGTGASGMVTIDGNTSQAFNGSSSLKPIIRRLVMSNAMGGSLTLNVPINISVSLTMTNGLINTSSTNSLTLTDETVTSTIGNSNSYVNGPIKYDVTSNSSQTLNFPIGKGTKWRPVVLNCRNSVATSITYNAEVFNASARALNYTLPVTVDTVSAISYWDVDRTLTSTGAALPTQSLTGTQAITLYYTSTDAVHDGANLTICKNTSTATTTWIDIGGTGATAGSGSVSSTSAPSAFTSYSRFTLGDKIGGNNPLPIELLNFTASANNHNVDVSWSTASELNNDYFTIEKSENGKDFIILDVIKGSGTSTIQNNYKLIDYKPFKGISYYRLKQTDYNKSFKYSNIVSVDLSNLTKTILIYPNPLNANTPLNIDINQYKNKKASVTITDVKGITVYSKAIDISEDNKKVYLEDLGSLSTGSYLVSIQIDDNIFTQQLIIK